MKRLPAFLMLISLVAFGCGGDSPTQSSDSDQTALLETGSQKGQKAPDFTLTSLDGVTVNLHARLSKPVFLNFWATWCGPCVAEMPDIEKLQQAMGSQIQIIGIDLGESSAQVKAFVQGQGFTWTFLLDTTSKIGQSYAVTAIPTSIFINTKGVITSRSVGSMRYDTMKRLAEDALKE